MRAGKFLFTASVVDAFVDSEFRRVVNIKEVVNLSLRSNLTVTFPSLMAQRYTFRYTAIPLYRYTANTFLVNFE